jgi:N-acetylglucosaminyldiphosphoundecaprenol N-acetyl-beta-D-mannosaminyltransferase
MQLNSKLILKTKLDYISVDELHNQISNSISLDKKIIIGNLNIHAANIAYSSDWFCKFINDCHIVFCDGKGIQLATWILGYPVPIQITYHTWLWAFFDFTLKRNYSLYLLGSKPGVVNKAIGIIKAKHPNLLINGSHGYFKKEGLENKNIIDEINMIKPDILIVGFGMPLQEKWIIDNKDILDSKIFLNGGAFLEWISGTQKQCPKFISSIGFEWLYRFFKEPRRLFKRYIIGNPLFIFRILKQKLGMI